MKLTSFTIPALALIFLATGCANYLSVGPSGTKFREENAPFAGNGLVGYKQGEAFHHRFVRQSKQPLYYNLVVRPVTVQHDGSTEKAATKARIAAGQVGSGGGDASTNKKISARYDIVEVTDDLPSKLNERRNGRVLEDLVNWGSNARIITAVAIAYGYKSSIDHRFSGDVTGRYNIYSGKMEISGSKERAVSLSDGTIFAYRMSKICWKRDRHGRLVIAEIVPDDPGNDMRCPNGSSDDPAKVPPL